MASFDRGPEKPTPLAVAGRLVAPNICYEDVFGDEIIAALPEAGILANLSNTAWFGHSLAQPQHLQIAQMRATETGRPMLRATNTGMTAIIAPDGSVVSALEPFTTGVLRGEVRAYAGSTPYIRFGDWPAVLLIALALLAGLKPRKS
jgi:apolipoprotein N-acyltransferase